MGIATPSFPSVTSLSQCHHPFQLSDKSNYLNSMSQDYSQGIFSFSNGFGRSQQQPQQQLLAQQIRRTDKARLDGFQPSPPLVAIEEEGPAAGRLPNPVYQNAGMLSEMFNFQSGATTATDLLQNQIHANYRSSRPTQAVGPGNEWYGERQVLFDGVMGTSDDSKNHNVVSAHDNISAHHHHHQQQILSINANSAAAMQLFRMNPQRRSPSPPAQAAHHPPERTSTLHMLLPNPSSTSTLQGFHTSPTGSATAFGPSQFTWVPDGVHQGGGSSTEIGGFVEGQTLSLSLSSSLQNLEAAKAEELRMGEGGMLLFNQAAGGVGSGSTSAQYPNYKYVGGHHQKIYLQCGLGQNHQIHQVGFGSSLGMVNALRHSNYAKAAKELLEEFCSVGRGHQLKKNKSGRDNTNPNSNNPSCSAVGDASSSKDLPSLSTADRLEHQRRKVKLLAMLDEVDRRYNHYCEEMQMLVNSFDLVMGFGGAIPYTALAQKAMSRHFRCLKDAITTQLKHSCMLLGEKDITTSGVTKGETPRLRLLEQSLRQQRAFHQIGMIEQEAWRPQRGLPERSVNILRAWLFEHFLNPYPSDADKHLLARQTGLSRNQVSNWFINARVRLWKPMVEEMYQQEAKDGETGPRETSQSHNQQNSSNNNNIITSIAQLPTSTTTPTATATTKAETETFTTQRSQINDPETDPSLIAFTNTQCFSENQAPAAAKQPVGPSSAMTSNADVLNPTVPPSVYGGMPAGGNVVRFGTASGDVSLTLGLRHAGNIQERNPFFS